MVTRKTTVTLKDVNGNEVKVDQESVKNVLHATTTDGKDVMLDETSEASQETNVTIMFDDIVSDGIPKMMNFLDSETPVEAWRVVNVAFFDGSKLVFSSPSKAAEYLYKIKDSQLLSPQEKATKVISIGDRV